MKFRSFLAVPTAVSAAVLLLWGCGGSSTGAMTDVVPPAVQQAAAQLDVVVPRWLARTGVPGASVSVVYGDSVVYSRGFGVRRVGESAPVDADTVFQIASVSKSIGATVMAGQMPGSATDGQITWDTAIEELLPWFELGYADPGLNARLTLGDLYSHRSGLHGHAGDRLEDLGWDRTDIMHRLHRARLNPVGTYDYTNFGLTSAAQAMADAYGTDWAALSERTLYQPLGMTHTSSRFADFSSRQNRAWGHVQAGFNYDTYGAEPAQYQVQQPARNPEAQSPAGGVSSSASDMARWMMLVLDRGRWGGQQLIAPLALQQAMTARPGEGAQYGYGFNVGTDPAGHAYVAHSGAFMLGAATAFYIFPEAKLGITVLTNAQPRGLSEAIVLQFSEQALQEVPIGQPSRDWLAFMQSVPEMHDLYKPEGHLVGQAPPANPASPQSLANYVGHYANDYYGDAEIALQPGGQALELVIGPRRLRYPLRHWDGDLFAFDLYSENAPPGTISAVQFSVGQMQIEYFGNDVTHGQFKRVP